MAYTEVLLSSLKSTREIHLNATAAAVAAHKCMFQQLSTTFVHRDMA